MNPGSQVVEKYCTMNTTKLFFLVKNRSSKTRIKFMVIPNQHRVVNAYI